MDFVSYIRDQNQKLNTVEYVNHLYTEIDDERHGKADENDEISPEAITDWNNHLPVLLEHFWDGAVEKIKTAEVEEIDCDLRKYIVVLLYHCISQSQHDSTIGLKCVRNACEVYLRLLAGRQREEFFHSRLYASVLTTLESDPTDGLIGELRLFLRGSKLSTKDLEFTLACLAHVVFSHPDKVFGGFVHDLVGDISYMALTCIKVLLHNETVAVRKQVVISYLLNGLRRVSLVHLTPHRLNTIQANFRALIRHLHHKFNEDNYATFLNAFINVWHHPDFCYYSEAVIIMNGLKETHYKALIDVLNKIMRSPTPPRSVIKLSLVIICNPSKHVGGEEKVGVYNEILIRSLIVNCTSKSSEVSATSLESLAELLLSPDLQKSYVGQPFRAIIDAPPGGNSLNVPSILRAFKALTSKKWGGNKSRNKSLFVIVVSIMMLSNDDYPGLYREMLEFLSEEASPFDLKSYLPLLFETYVKMSEKGFQRSASQILKIMFRMSLHPMASSTDFVKCLYSAMVFPSVCKGVNVKSDIFIDPLISEDYNFKEFCQKCHSLGLIRKDHITKLMGSLYQINTSNMKLVCALIHLTDYKELSVISDHVNDNFQTICHSPDLNYLFYVYNRMIAASGSSPNALGCNSAMHRFLKHHLTHQTLRWSSVSNGFALLKSLSAVTNLAEDFRQLAETYDDKLVQAMRSRSSFLALLYYSQLVVFGRVVPGEEKLGLVRDYLTLCPDAAFSNSVDFNPKLWIGCLLFYTNVCLIRTSLAESGLDYLQHGLNSSVTAVKLAAINMTFDLCNLVTHNFEDLINYMFSQLVDGDPVFRRTCLFKLDRLIRDDYLKLDLTQYLVFVTTLGDRNSGLGDYLLQLLSENFLISHVSIIAKYFVPLIVHINGYRKHPVYQLGDRDYSLVLKVSRNVIDRRRIYRILMTNLSNKARFNVVYHLGVNILEKMMKGTLKFDEAGYWKMVKDAIFIFKSISSTNRDDDICQQYYKKIVQKIVKNILNKGPGEEAPTERSLFTEHQKEILKCTEILTRLLLFNDSNSVQQHIRISVFDALMHWTDFLMADLVHIVHVERSVQVQDFYKKVDAFYRKNAGTLIYSEESFESESNLSSHSASNCSIVFSIHSSASGTTSASFDE